MGSTVLFGVLGIVYGLFFKQDQWLASQALLVREEANGAPLRLGRFDSDTQMKAAQETILEVARHNQVVGEALKAVGPQPGWFSWWGSKNWPSKGTIEATANSKISMRAPRGAEFGATEVIYLDVKQPSPERALTFSVALCDALEVRLQYVRKTRAESIVTELTQARDSAREQLKEVTEELQKFERVAGIELSDLRGMTDMIAGGGNSRIQLDQLKTEIRVVETNHQELLDDLKLLEEAIADPSSFVIAPTNLVTAQPGLKRLREGYAEAQLSASQLSGKFTDVHPLLIAARTTQDSIRSRLVSELNASLGSLNQEIKTSQQKLDRLRAVQTNTEMKLESLAENRAEYANVIAEVKTRATILENVERELAEAEASAKASSSTSLISRMDQPTVSDSPLGPGKATIAGCCAIAGLLFGLGIVFVLSPNESVQSFRRRITDIGRRREDQAIESEKDIRIPSTPLASQETIAVAPAVDKPTIDSERVLRTLAASESRRERPTPATPVFFDEHNLDIPTKLPTPKKVETIPPVTEPAPVSHPERVASTKALERPKNSTPAAEEHPKDSSFRDFLLAEINNADDRRQHPRTTQPRPATASLSLRPSAATNKSP